MSFFQKRLSKYILLVLLLVANIAWWSYIDRPREVKPSPEKLDCVSYNPYKDKYELNAEKDEVDVSVIDADLAIIAQKFRCVRTYSTLHGMDQVPEMAKKHGLTVVLGVWISSDLMENMHDLDIAIELANTYPGVVTHLLIGNEALFFKNIPPRHLYLYLLYANKMTPVPVSTGEIVSTWNEHKMLADMTDFVAIHIFPYWNNVPID